MGGVFEVLIAGEEADYAEQAALAAFEELALLELELSRFEPASDVSRVNRLRKGERIAVGPAAFECLRLAVRFAEETAGAFDPAYATERPAGAPALALEPQTHTVCALAERVQIDLGGVGKGYAVDQMVEQLRAWDIASALVHADESAAFALGEEEWEVSLRDPFDPARAAAVVSLRARALAGSGVQVQGRHIVDPRTRAPAQAAVAAWAAAPTAAQADALSTAFMVMTRQEVEAFCVRAGDVEAWLWPAEADDIMHIAGR